MISIVYIWCSFVKEHFIYAFYILVGKASGEKKRGQNVSSTSSMKEVKLSLLFEKSEVEQIIPIHLFLGSLQSPGYIPSNLIIFYMSIRSCCALTQLTHVQILNLENTEDTMHRECLVQRRNLQQGAESGCGIDSGKQAHSPLKEPISRARQRL